MKNNEQEPLISIIIPVYNSFEKMDECLKSLNNQTVKDFEVIFIDDFSTDNSYINLKNKLKLYNFKNRLIKNELKSGPGVTRNKGIKMSNGKYLTFIDSDDYVDIKFIEIIKKFIDENDNVDAIIFDYFIKNKSNLKLCSGLPFKEGKVSVNDAVALSKGMCWAKVYKKSIVSDNNLIFPDLIRSEDLAFSKTFLYNCKNIYYLRNALYYYVINPTSIMNSKNTMNIENNKKAFEYIKNKTKYNDSIEIIFIREYLYLIVQIMILMRYKNKEIKDFITKSCRDNKKWYKNKYIKYQPFYVKVLLICIRFKILFPLRLVFKLKE